MRKDFEQILQKARETYGNKNQILVCMEELNELACVLAKYPRYDDEDKARSELINKVLDEVADVTIILSHVRSIFNISNESLSDRIDKKVDRLDRWLNHSNSMQETIDDRTVGNLVSSEAKHLCSGCIFVLDPTERTYNERCVHCLKAQATEGIAPFRRTVHIEEN